MEGVLQAMAITKLKLAGPVLILASVVCLPASILTYMAAGEPESAKATRPRSAHPMITPTGNDRDKWQGVWKLVAAEVGGKAVATTGTPMVLLVYRNRASLQYLDKEDLFGLYLDTKAKPKAFDFAETAETIEGVYSLEGDVLRLCFVPGEINDESPRPEQLATKPGDKRVLYVFNRHAGLEGFHEFRRPDGSRDRFPNLVEHVFPNLPRRVAEPRAVQPAARLADQRSETTQNEPSRDGL